MARRRLRSSGFARAPGRFIGSAGKPFPIAPRAPSPLDEASRQRKSKPSGAARSDQQRLAIALTTATLRWEQQIDHHEGQQDLRAESEEEEEKPVEQHANRCGGSGPTGKKLRLRGRAINIGPADVADLDAAEAGRVGRDDTVRKLGRDYVSTPNASCPRSFPRQRPSTAVLPSGAVRPQSIWRQPASHGLALGRTRICVQQFA